MNIEQLVKKFLAEEQFTLRNALAYAGLGLFKTGGAISKVVTDIAFNAHSYNDERKKQVAEDLGEMMFYWHVLASTVDMAPDVIMQEFVNLYLVKNNVITDEMHISIKELMKHMKKASKLEEIERKKDEKLKRESREKLIIK